MPFPEGGWTFDDGSALLRIYPVSYFEGFVLRWTVVVVAMSVPLGVFGVRRLTRSPQFVRRSPSGVPCARLW